MITPGSERVKRGIKRRKLSGERERDDGVVLSGYARLSPFAEFLSQSPSSRRIPQMGAYSQAKTSSKGDIFAVGWVSLISHKKGGKRGGH